jgi:hypothetical protein
MCAACAHVRLLPSAPWLEALVGALRGRLQAVPVTQLHTITHALVALEAEAGGRVGAAAAAAREGGGQLGVLGWEGAGGQAGAEAEAAAGAAGGKDEAAAAAAAAQRVLGPFVAYLKEFFL